LPDVDKGTLLPRPLRTRSGVPIAAVMTVLLALVVSAGCLEARQAAPKFDGGRAYADLREIVALGPRPAGSAAIQRTRDYIKKQLLAAGLTPEEQPFDARTPIGVIHMVNIRATLPGPASARGRIVIGGHYDTKLARDFPFVGASDGGSSTAFLLELARALKGRVNSLPIELLFLDGEEATLWDWDTRTRDHTYGSQYYVDTAKKAGTLKDIRAFILVDMIGDRDLQIRRESYSTQWLTDIIWATAARLKHPEFDTRTTPIEDDHLPFLEAGVDAVDLIDLDYAAWHTREDTLDQVSARSLEVVGDVLLAALPDIEKRLAAGTRQ
jgi:glutaminyl-peptide cyclotransferase